MVYKVYLRHTTEIIDFEHIYCVVNYEIDNKFITFYGEISIPGSVSRKYNLCSYRSSDVCKIEFFEKKLNQIRENKLKRILKKNNIFKIF